MNHVPARLRPDSLAVLIFAVSITSLLAIVSFMLSFSGLVASAEWASVPAWLAWSVPVTIDGAILVYTVAAYVFRERGDRGSTVLSWLSLALWAAVSVAANALHAAEVGPEVQRVVGVVIAGLAPVAVLLTTHTLGRLIVPTKRPDAVEEALRSIPAELFGRDELADYAAADAALTSALYAVPKPEAPKARRSKPTPERDARIRELYAELGSVRAVADELGIGKTTVSRVISQPVDEPEPDTPAVAAALA